MLNLVSRVKNFVSHHIAGDSDFVPDEDAVAIDNKYDEIRDDLSEVRGDLERIDEDVATREIALKNFKNSELVIGGALAGGAVGASLGLGKEMFASFVAPAPEVVVSANEFPITRTSLVDAAEPWIHHEQELTDANGSINGWRHTYTASTQTETVGEYTTRAHELKGATGGSPLVSGLMWAGAGAALGAGAGAAMIGLRRFIPDGEYEESDRRNTKNDNGLLVRFGIAGAGAGAGVGALAAALEAAKSDTVTYVTEAPVLENQVIGQIPSDWTESLGGSDVNNPGLQDVPAQNPVMEGLFGGSPKLEETKVEVDVAGRFGYLGGVVGGAAVGAAAGVATGVLVNVIRKTI